MLKNKKFQAILSLLIAIGLWVYVMGTVDPTVTTTIRDVTVEKINEDVLEEKGLSAELERPHTVNIEIKGTRSNVNEAKEGEIRATVDVSNCDYGKNLAEIKVKLPDGVSGVRVESISQDAATFTVK